MLLAPHTLTLGASARRSVAPGCGAPSLQPRLHSHPGARPPLRQWSSHPLQLKDVNRQLCTVVCAAAQAPSGTAPPQAPAEVAIAVEGVQALPVAQGVVLLRSCSKDRVKYEIEYGLKRGSTDNSYLVTVPGRTARVLVDVPLAAFKAPFLEALEGELPPSDLTHVVLTHLDAKSIPSLEGVLRAATAGRAAGEPKLQLVLTNPAAQLLEQQADLAELLSRVQLVVTKGDNTIDLDGIHSMSTLLTPTPRWPDLMSVYLPRRRILFTSKLFSAHVMPGSGGQPSKNPFDLGGWQAYGYDWRYFFDCMLAPVAKQAAAALDKLELNVRPVASSTTAMGLLDRLFQPFTNALSAPSAGGNALLEVRLLCPMHGPVVRSSLRQLLREYGEWIEEQAKASSVAHVAVLYASAYGNTAALAQAISSGIIKGGVAAETYNLELVSVDEVMAAMRQASGFIVGSPTLGGHMPTPVQVALGGILRTQSTRALPCSVFGSFGWSGEAVDEMEKKLKDAGYSFAFKPIRVKFKPTAADLQLCEQSGRDLAVAVKRSRKVKERSAASTAASSTSRTGSTITPEQMAMGRVVGSLCVVTAQDEDASSAMLASWVSQASFTPPGLTLAVKKDRAIERLLVPGGKFNVSMIPEGKEKMIMKALARPFKPADDRLEGLETTPSPNTGFPVLSDAHAYLECEVESRMEAGDHWCVYARVDSGKVLQENERTAVHHRKVGSHY